MLPTEIENLLAAVEQGDPHDPAPLTALADHLHAHGGLPWLGTVTKIRDLAYLLTEAVADMQSAATPHEGRRAAGRLDNLTRERRQLRHHVNTTQLLSRPTSGGAPRPQPPTTPNHLADDLEPRAEFTLWHLIDRLDRRGADITPGFVGVTRDPQGRDATIVFGKGACGPGEEVTGKRDRLVTRLLGAGYSLGELTNTAAAWGLIVTHPADTPASTAEDMVMATAREAGFRTA